MSRSARDLRRTRGRPYGVAHGDAQGGYTLVEILVAVAIMGIAVVGIMMSLATILNVSTVGRSLANVDQVTRKYSENATAATYTACASSYSSVTLPSGYSFSSGPTITYWKGDNPATFAASCSSDQGVQRIAATIREQSSGQTASVVVIKNRG
jgi:prepilin-type N-terminal cleavage/methylation domain-containing protein